MVKNKKRIIHCFCKFMLCKIKLKILTPLTIVLSFKHATYGFYRPAILFIFLYEHTFYVEFVLFDPPRVLPFIRMSKSSKPKVHILFTGFILNLTYLNRLFLTSIHIFIPSSLILYCNKYFETTIFKYEIRHIEP